jgi:sulfatase modifying factor 1
VRKLFIIIIAIFCVMGLTAQAQVTQEQPTRKASATKATHPEKAGGTYRNCQGCPQMVVIYAGRFDMGSHDSEDGRSDDEGPVHSVNITEFAIGKTEITRGQFAEFVKETRYSTGDKCWTLEDGKYKERKGSWREPGYPQDDNNPAVCINWNDAQAYVKWLSHKTGRKYRLPTEAEWEYAARGGTGTARYWGSNPDDACAYANGADKTAQALIQGATSWSIQRCTDGFAYTAPVGHFKPNAFGLYDMLGNVWEWTEDIYHADYKGAPTDGSAWQGDGDKRLLRGGSWNNSPRDVRAAVRYKSDPGLRFSSFGFRVVRSYK